MRADERRSVLVIDDDVPFARTLARALERRGWLPRVAHTAREALAAASAAVPDAAIVDLRLDVDDGLRLIEPLREANAGMRIVVLTGYASIATAVNAIKRGADDYLAKPVTGAVVADALNRRDAADPVPLTPTPMSPRRLEWEHLQRVLAEHGGNISSTARALQMHRRTLQRKLGKRPMPK
jgi:two-component system response regulator RegA